MGDSNKRILEVDELHVEYGRAVLALNGLSIHVERGEIVALLGANGAGKSTTLKAITNVLGLEDGAIRSGSIRFDGVPTSSFQPDQLVKRGMFHVMEGRRIFSDLTVLENLRVAGFARSERGSFKSALDLVFGYFPKLAERKNGMAGYLSGGEQQMLAIGRALVAQPKLILLDEPSLGIAPKLVEDIFSIIARINREQGVSMLLVEQNAMMAFSVASRAYVVENGRAVLNGATVDLAADPAIRELYLGIRADAGSARRIYQESDYSS